MVAVPIDNGTVYNNAGQATMGTTVGDHSSRAQPARHRFWPLMLALVAGCLPAAQAQPTGGDAVTVSGNAAYRQRIALPPEAVLTVRLEALAPTDVPAQLLAESRLPLEGRQVPIPFELRVPRAAIDPAGRYGISATIAVDGERRFMTLRPVAVLTQGAADWVELLLVPVSPPPTAATPGRGELRDAADATPAELLDTYWKLVELDGQPIAMAPTAQREVRITLASGGTRAFGFAGCNTFTGAYTHEGSTLRFTQLAGTQMACVAPFMALEKQILDMLGSSTGYRIDGQRLTLLTGTLPLARFEAVYLR